MRRLSAALGAAALLVLGVSGVAVASEAPQGTISVTPAASAGGAITATDTPTVNGEFHMSGSGTVDSISIVVHSTAKTPPAPDPSPLDGCGSPDPCKATSVHFSKKLAKIAYNGPYDIYATAKGTELADIDGQQQGTAKLPAGPVRIEVPPAAPGALKAVASANPRNVTLTWARNSEPDMMFYVIQRKVPGDSGFREVARADDPKTGTEVTYRDGSLANVGGDIAYQVIAVRRADPDNTQRAVASAPSSPVTATLAAPPPTTTGAPATVPAAGPTPAGSSKPSPLPAPVISRSGSFDVSKLKLPDSPAPAPADGPFSETLPYGAAPDQPPDTTPPPDTHSQALGVHNGPAKSTGHKALLLPLSGGAALLVGAFQLRWIGARL